MTLRNLLMWGMMASLLAGCSGGAAKVAGSSAIPSAPSSGTTASSQMAALSVSFVVAQPQATTQSNKRQVKYISPAINDVHYTALEQGVGVNATTDLPLSTCVPTTSNGSGTTETCNIYLAPGSYTIQLNLDDCTTPAPQNSGTASGCTLVAMTATSGTVGPIASGGPPGTVALQAEPVTGGGSGSGPVLSLVSGSPKMLFIDQTTNVVSIYANELDPVGNVISTYYGPMCTVGTGPDCGANDGWPTLTLASTGAAGSANGVAVNQASPSNFPFILGAPPSGQLGSIELIEFNGTSNNTSDLVLTLTDQFGNSAPMGSTNTLDFPYITLSGTANGTPLATTTAGGYGTSGNPVHLGSTAGTLTIVATEKTTNDNPGYGVPDAADSETGYLNGLGFVTYSTCASSVISSYVADSGGAGSGIGLYPIQPENPTTSSGLTYTLTTTGSTSGEPNPCEYVIQSQADPDLSMMIYLASP